MAQKIFQKYSLEKKYVQQSGVSLMIKDAYKAINKNHTPELDEVSHYIEHHS